LEYLKTNLFSINIGQYSLSDKDFSRIPFKNAEVIINLVYKLGVTEFTRIRIVLNQKLFIRKTIYY